MRRLISFSGLLAAGFLSGCQGFMPASPIASHEPYQLLQSCQWPAEQDVLASMKAVSQSLALNGYNIVDTDAKLGLVSAERRTRRYGLDSWASPWPSAWDRRFGHFNRGPFGFYSRFGNRGYYGGYDYDAVQIDRVSIVTPDKITYVTRDSRVVSYDGYLIDARSNNREDFCQFVHQSMQASGAQSVFEGDTP